MIRLVTVATHIEGYLPWLKQSCDRFNVKLIILGFNQEWLGFSWRFKLMIDYLKTIDPNDLVIFIDAYDVILLRPLDEIEIYFNNIIKITNTKIIISEDLNINSINEINARILFGTCKNVRICAGLYMGRSIDILNIISIIYQNIQNKDDDQILFTSYCNKYPENIYIDTDNIFFLSRSYQLKNILEDKNIKINNNILTYMNSQPFFIHGNANTYMHDVILKLGYNILNNEIEEIIYKYKKIKDKKNVYYFNLFLKKFYYVILIILLIILLIIIIIRQY